jgi:ribosomal protein L11 methyltransferase
VTGDPERVVMVQVAVPADEAELASDVLWLAGATAIEERAGPHGVVLVAAAGGGGDPRPLLAAVGRRWPAETVPADLGAALDAWRRHARPVPAGRRLRVVPPWLAPPPEPGRVDVLVDPGRAFGSGAHVSTRLALAAVESVVTGGEAVLDVGCGSGVLALAALALGAARAIAVDIDPAARAATVANAASNGLADRVAVAGAVRGRHDLVVANLLLPDHEALAGTIVAALAPRGSLVAGGVLATQRDRLVAAYGAAGLTSGPAAEMAEDGWLALTWRRAPAGP